MTTLHATIPSMTVPDGEQQRKKRSRGRSLRTNVLLRPRRVSLKSQPPPHLGLGVTTATDVSLVLPPNEHVDEYSSDDYDQDGSEDEDRDEEYDDEDLEEARFPYPPIRSRSGSLVMVMSGMGRSRSEEVESAKDTVYWGWVVLVSTWLVFVVGMGSVCGVWDWAWGVGSDKGWPRSVGGEKGFPGEFPIPGYYPALCILTCVMAWVWVVVAWVGMKYFKHAKIQS